MAMIQCPECGQEISDKATTCPHCGTPIFVCPECGHISVGNIPFCENCGFTTDTKVLSAQPHDVKKQDSHAETTAANDIVELWLKNNPQERKRRNLATIIGLVCLLGYLICGIIMYFVNILPWQNLNQDDVISFTEMTLNYASYKRSIWIIASIAIILWMIDTSTEIYINRWDMRCSRWLQQQNVDVKSALKKESSDLFFNGVRKHDWLKVNNSILRGIYYSRIKNTNSVFIVCCIVSLTINLLFLIFICWGANLCNQLIIKVIDGQKMMLDVSETMFMFLLFLMALLVVSISIITLFNQKTKKYLQQELHD